jgi:hypothetical protein
LIIFFFFFFSFLFFAFFFSFALPSLNPVCRIFVAFITSDRLLGPVVMSFLYFFGFGFVSLLVVVVFSILGVAEWIGCIASFGLDRVVASAQLVTVTVMVTECGSYHLSVLERCQHSSIPDIYGISAR